MKITKFFALLCAAAAFAGCEPVDGNGNDDGGGYIPSDGSMILEVDNQALKLNDSVNFNIEYSLHRPFNLYEAYWCNPDDYGVNATLSPNAWVNRLNADTETETKYNKKELDRMGYYTTNAAGEKILDYRILKKRLIWAQKNPNVVHCADEGIEWM
jgi:hypothetical protein